MDLIEILMIVAGIVYGYTKPGKEDRFKLFKEGVIWALIFGFIVTILRILIERKFLSSTLVGIFVFIDVIILAVLFIVGTYIGDYLEFKTKKK